MVFTLVDSDAAGMRCFCCGSLMFLDAAAGHGRIDPVATEVGGAIKTFYDPVFAHFSGGVFLDAQFPACWAQKLQRLMDSVPGVVGQVCGYFAAHAD
ncbi:hypothetical protein Nepgr_025993 [Nepenthes gracilis]|uniref:Uncharacterized protein n=1 Tax=Nepenthes gracilis TaxID=150966 RepID=A0AAD3Y1M8_NEPGR|nr:hypothetical protein Nepgr_025993 [Nepenthes gracilis]